MAGHGGGEGCVVFVCLQVEARATKGILERLISRMLRQKVRLEEASALGARYLLAEVSLPKGKGICWDSIIEELPPAVSCVLAPDGYLPPPKYAPYPFRKFERGLLLETASGIVANSQIPVYRRIAGLYDPRGGYVDFLPTLLKQYTSVRVVTNEGELYRQAAERMMEEFGAPVISGGQPSDFADCALLILPGDDSLPVAPRCPVLSQRDLPYRAVFSRPWAKAPAAPPPGIDRQLFIGAIFEYGQNAKPEPSSLVYQGRRIPFDQARQMLRQKAGYLMP